MLFLEILNDYILNAIREDSYGSGKLIMAFKSKSLNG